MENWHGNSFLLVWQKTTNTFRIVLVYLGYQTHSNVDTSAIKKRPRHNCHYKLNRHSRNLGTKLEFSQDS